MKKFVWFVAFILLIMIGANAIAATITFDNDSVSIQKGKSIIINARIDDLPEGIKAGKFTWISTDESVATCKNGKVSQLPFL